MLKPVKDSGINTDVEYITDMEKVMSHGVISMPAIVIDAKVVVSGKPVKPKDIEK